ncbi:hypothetical protein MMC19_005921 [Ptychographa xylographoides]|nr:hypothetical protein [Ptychographa xylographoides]
MDQEDYDLPDDYGNLDEVVAPSPDENPHERSTYRHESLEESRSRNREDTRAHYRRQDSLERRQKDNTRRHSEHAAGDEEDEDENLTELAVPPPVDRGDDTPVSTEGFCSGSGTGRPEQEGDKNSQSQKNHHHLFPHHERASKFATKLYTISYLILFSILGTLARLGLQALTFYPGAPVTTGVLWANLAGSFCMGFLSEDRKLFREEWGPSKQQLTEEAQRKRSDEEDQNPSSAEEKQEEHDHAAQGAAHGKVKKTIPLYVGLATGFCGSFTSFSSFIRDVFLALSNDLPVPVSRPPSSSTSIAVSSIVPRNGGYDFMALLAIILLTLTLCLGGLQGGAHLAIALEPYTPSIPFYLGRKIIDRAVVVLAFTAWVGTILLATFPPDRPTGPDSHGTWAQETWRGEVLYALVFAPLGCLLRFYVSLHLNARVAAFPLGTFAVNIGGTALLGMFYDLQHVPLLGGNVGCQVLQGLQDGFCGALTTVSTWVAELKGLQRRHAYIYGSTSVLAALALLVVEMGSLRWTHGFGEPVCGT